MIDRKRGRTGDVAAQFHTFLRCPAGQTGKFNKAVVFDEVLMGKSVAGIHRRHQRVVDMQGADFCGNGMGFNRNHAMLLDERFPA